nr:hypothetical protein [uncultured Draconibacterium sp.]
MSLGGFIRRSTYWANDFFQNSPIRRHYKDIKSILENKNNTGIITQKRHLDNILKHAVGNASFYSSYNPNNIESFPVINKFIIREKYEYFKIDTSQIPEHKGRLHIQQTSGSSGTTLTVLEDKRKRNRLVAELKYFGEFAGYRSHEKLAYLRIWVKSQTKSRIQSFRENIFAINSSRIDDEMLADLCLKIKTKKIVAILGYASWYDKLLDYIEKHSIKLPSIKVILAGSEMLQPTTKVGLKKALNCKVISRYANQEQGVLGQDKDEDENYYLNHASYYFEFLKLDSDEKASPGEICRIVVTDLFNYAFPLIRYDTGDTGIYSNDNVNANGFSVLSKLYGRRWDLIYASDGTAIHPITLAALIKHYSEVELWQFIQKDINKYELKLKLTTDIDLSDCKIHLKEVFGSNSIIEISLVDEIPVLASGKRKPIVNEWKK